MLLDYVFEINRHRGSRYPLKLLLQKDIRSYFETLKLKWEKDSDDESMADEEKDVPDEEITIDDLFGHEEEINDTDMGDSGSEEEN